MPEAAGHLGDVTRERIAADLRADPPGIHRFGDEVMDWGLSWEALDWLLEVVEPGMRTVETGCGRSSIVFAAAGAEHTVVSPADQEHQRVLEWCKRYRVPTDKLTMVAAHSQDVLPGLGDEPLDVVLLDGSHAFPMPFVDWLYLARRMKVGGRVLIDDMHIRTCRVLFDFLRADSERWALEAEPERAVAFRRTGDPLIPFEDWTGQPWATGPPMLSPPEVGQWFRNGVRKRARRAAARVRRR